MIVEREKKMNPISNKAVNQLILGSLLGDTSLNMTSKNPRLHVCHSKDQEEYVWWKYNILSQSFDITKPRDVMSGIDKKYPQVRFQSPNSQRLNYYKKLFYPNGKKAITRNLLNMLEPLALAIWYMDDGNLIIHKYTKMDGTKGVKSRELAINTQCFSYEEHEIIKRYFEVKWDIKVKIYKNKGSFRIVMNATNAKKFVEIIEPFIIPSMNYKIDLQYT